jgi:CubicO group peptidase (beta-lactamase class C family)
MTELEGVLARIVTWGAEHAAAAVLGPTGVLAARGDPGHVFRWASVTKPVTALTVLVGFERGLIDLDEPAGPQGATVRHLLAPASGLPFEGGPALAAPETRRVY